jgi:hypothetical protein
MHCLRDLLQTINPLSIAALTARMPCDQEIPMIAATAASDLLHPGLAATLLTTIITASAILRSLCACALLVMPTPSSL